jgi:hypothetical protein
MSYAYSKLADTTSDNQTSTRKLTAPDGPLTRWRQAHPAGNPIAWQESLDLDFSLLHRMHGGPFMVDQEATPQAYELFKRSYRAQVDGFRAVAFRVTMHYGIDHPESADFMVLTIDTPRAVPRTAIRPAVFGDRLHRGYQGIKTGNAEFDHEFHVQAEDEQFAKALLSPTTMQFLHNSQLAKTFAFVFEGTTLSTWSHGYVLGPDNNYPPEQMSMLTEYIVQIFMSTPGELWRD